MNISFVYPGFLLALSLLAIPVIIHLFNFRKFRKVYFTNVRFLRELKQETTSQSRLKHLLILLARLLAVAFLVAAFAQPYIPAAAGKKLAAERVVSIYIDNSFSMEAVTREGTLLDVAKNTAREIVSAYRPSDRFQLLTNEFSPEQQRIINRDDFLSRIEDIKPGPVSRNLDEVLTRQMDVVNNSAAESRSAVMISDFQTSVVKFDNVINDSTVDVSLIPVGAEKASNIMVDSCWFSSPVVQLGELAELNVRIRNLGSIDVSAVPVKLSINDVQKAVAAADIPELGFVDIKLSFTTTSAGWQKGLVHIEDNPILFDDNYYFSYFVSSEAQILSVNKQLPGPYLTALFAPGGYFRLSNISERQLDYGAFSQNKIIFLNELQTISTGLSSELNKFINQGGVVVVIPDSSLDFSSYGSFLQSLGIAPFTSLNLNNEKVEKLLLEDDLFSGVFANSNKINDDTDLPSVNGYFIQAGTGTESAEALMKLRGGAPLLSRYRIGKGEVYLFAVSFSGQLSNFSRHALFVPVIYRMALLSERSGKLAYSIGVDDQIELPNITLGGDQVFHIVNENRAFDVIPAHRSTTSGMVVTLNNSITEAGNYELKLANQLIAAPSFNYNRSESVMTFMGSDQLNEMISENRLTNFKVMDVDNVEMAGTFTLISEGTPLWKYCIILVLLFLACEILLLKFWKK